MKKACVIGVVFALGIALLNSGCIPLEKLYGYSAWVVGDVAKDGKAMILYSDDSGGSWSRQGTDVLPDGENLSDVYAVSMYEVWAVGSGGLLIKTNNGGKNWKVVDLPDELKAGELAHISIFEDDIWLSGNGGLIGFSKDGGKSWTVADLPEGSQEYLLQGIHAINNDLVYAVGNKSTGTETGIVLRTEDGGLTWDRIVLPNDYNVNGWIGVKATDENHVIIFGGKGHYAVTANGGKQWVAGGPLFWKDLNSLVMLDERTYWAACDFDTIILTRDSGISWEEQPSAGTGNSFLLGIAALDRNHALIAGGSAGYPQFGKILRTSNGGQSWEVVLDGDECDVPLWHVAIAKHNYMAPLP